MCSKCSICMRKPIKLWKHDAILEIVHLEAEVLMGEFLEKFREKLTVPGSGHRSAFWTMAAADDTMRGIEPRTDPSHIYSTFWSLIRHCIHQFICILQFIISKFLK